MLTNIYEITCQDNKSCTRKPESYHLSSVLLNCAIKVISSTLFLFWFLFLCCFCVCFCFAAQAVLPQLWACICIYIYIYVNIHWIGVAARKTHSNGLRWSILQNHCVGQVQLTWAAMIHLATSNNLADIDKLFYETLFKKLSSVILSGFGKKHQQIITAEKTMWFSFSLICSWFPVTRLT